MVSQENLHDDDIILYRFLRDSFNPSFSTITSFITMMFILQALLLMSFHELWTI
jgi:DNA-binding phage protein